MVLDLLQAVLVLVYFLLVRLYFELFVPETLKLSQQILNLVILFLDHKLFSLELGHEQLQPFTQLLNLNILDIELLNIQRLVVIFLLNTLRYFL